MDRRGLIGQIINAGIWQDKVRAMFGLQGGANPVETIEQLVPVVVVENDRPEFSFAAGEHRYSRMSFIGAGGAGVLSVVGLHNPPDSGYIAVITRAWARCDPAGAALGTIALEWGNAALGNARGKVPRDGRIANANVNGGIQLIDVADTSANLSLTTIDIFNPEVEAYTQPIIMQPASRVWLVGVDGAGARRANLAMIGGFSWHIKPLHKGSRG